MDHLRIYPEWRDILDAVPDVEFRSVVMRMLDFSLMPDSAEPPDVSDYEQPTRGLASALMQNVHRAKIAFKYKRGNKAEIKRNKSGDNAEKKRRKSGPISISISNSSSLSTTTAHTREKLPPTIDQFVGMAGVAGVPADFARYLFGELEKCAWTDGKGRAVDNPIRYLKSAWVAEQKKSFAPRGNGEAAGLAAIRDA